MKTKNIIGILAMTMLLLLVMPSVSAESGEALLNYSYFGSTPDTRSSIESRPENCIQIGSAQSYNVTNGQCNGTTANYTTWGRDDITLTLQVRVNMNMTDNTYTLFYLDGSSYTPTLIDGNTTIEVDEAANASDSLGNITMIVSNLTEGTHEYYFVVAVHNATNAINISGCQSGFTCTSYAVNDATKPNITEITTTTRYFTVLYDDLNIICGDGVCTSSEVATCEADCGGVTDEKLTDNKLTIFMVIVIAIAIFIAYEKKK